MPLFTVFTPTFNRAHTLPRLYESLKRQTYRDFEWVIVDDGSTDSTCELVKKWRDESEFLIRYFYQANKGKHVAFNRGVQEAQGEFFLPIDSDDACMPHALERFKFYWDSLPSSKKEYFSGVCALCQDQDMKLIGNKFPFDVTDSNSLEINYRYKVRGDKWGFQCTEVLRRYPFPEIDGVRFIPEGIVWNAIAKYYKIRFINEILLNVYRCDAPDGSDQLTQYLKTYPIIYARGCSFYYMSCLNENIDWFRYAPLEFIRAAVHYTRFFLHSGLKITEAIGKIRSTLGKLLCIVTIPLGGALYASEKRNVNLIHKYALAIQTVKDWMAKFV